MKLLCSIGKIIILDSRFHALQGIVKLFKRGVCTLALIEKYHYLPKGALGKVMNDRITNKEISETDTIRERIDGVDCNSFSMKDEDLTIKLMSTCRKLEVEHNTKNSVQCI